MSKQYLVGEVYFRVTYPDMTMLYPRVEPFVYVGMNLSDEDPEPTWYFQFADSYVRSGSITNGGGEEGTVSLATEQDLPDMLDNDALISELSDAAQRRRATQSNSHA